MPVARKARSELAQTWRVLRSGFFEMINPTLLPLGDRALLIRFSTEISDAANLAAIALARHLEAAQLDGVEEIAPGLVSVLLRLRSAADFPRVRGEVTLRVGTPADISRACMYLTNVENDFVTGANLVVDGGMTRKMIYEH